MYILFVSNYIEEYLCYTFRDNPSYNKTFAVKFFPITNKVSLTEIITNEKILIPLNSIFKSNFIKFTKLTSDRP